MNYRISKSYTIPPRGKAGKKGSKYPFSQMDIGDSFAVPIELRSRLSAALVAYARKKDGWGYTTRKVGEKLRIWRTA